MTLSFQNVFRSLSVFCVSLSAMNHSSVSRLSVSRWSGHGRHNSHEAGGHDDDADDRHDDECEGVEPHTHDDDVHDGGRDDHHGNGRTKNHADAEHHDGYGEDEDKRDGGDHD